jgi:hypothetical protein
MEQVFTKLSKQYMRRNNLELFREYEDIKTEILFLLINAPKLAMNTQQSNTQLNVENKTMENKTMENKTTETSNFFKENRVLVDIISADNIADYKFTPDKKIFILKNGRVIVIDFTVDENLISYFNKLITKRNEIIKEFMCVYCNS